MPGALLKLLVKDKLLHSGKIPVNAELRPWGERNEERKFSDTVLWTRRWRCDGITFNFYIGLPHIFPHPFIHTCPFIAQERLDSTRKLLIWVNPCFHPHCLFFYHTLHMDIAISMYPVKVELYNNIGTNQFRITQLTLSLILKPKPGNKAKHWVQRFKGWCIRSQHGTTLWYFIIIVGRLISSRQLQKN